MNEIQYTVTGHPVRMQGAAYIPRSIQALQALSQWRNEGAAMEQGGHTGPPLQWLREDICKAFKHFLALRLGSTPAVEMLPIVAEEWVDVVGEGMTEDNDRERIRTAFNLLRRQLKWWPQPAELLKALPRRTAPATNAHPAQAQPSDEDHAAASARFQDILDSLK